MNVIDRVAPLVDFLGAALGPRTEVVLHDLTSKERSVVAIANGHISGRRVGSPVTDLVLRTLKRGSIEGANSLIGYRGTGADGRTLRSSSYFLREATGEIVGILCINTDVSGLMRIQEVLGTELAAIIGEAPEQTLQDPGPESLSGSVDDLRNQLLDSALTSVASPTSRLSAADRKALVATLDESGLFLLKGGVAAAAERLGVSEPTIYRYLTKVRGE